MSFGRCTPRVSLGPTHGPLLFLAADLPQTTSNSLLLVPSSPSRVSGWAGRYEAAVDLAEAVLEGEPRAAAVRKALASMAAACALKQVGRPGSRTDVDSFAGMLHPGQLQQGLARELPPITLLKPTFQPQA